MFSTVLSNKDFVFLYMQNFLNYINSALQGKYNPCEIRSFAYLIIENVCGMSRTDIIVSKNTIFSDANRQKMNSFVDKLQNNMPIQYVLGQTYFYNAEFSVTQDVLIPRPETEELVDWIVNDFRNNDSPKILDIGTGSGCIAISLKKELQNAEVSAFDISNEALLVARDNAKRNAVDVYFEQVDILNIKKSNNKWDCIVSNPPYIPDVEKIEILPNVLDYEPHLALFVPNNDPLLFYKKIALFGTEHLVAGACLYFEIHKNYGMQCVDMLKNIGYVNVELKKDIFDKDRMIKAKWDNNSL